eukprot:COSAG04_NODE_3466_length_2793_cov_1.687082_3_plen_254_part_00
MYELQTTLCPTRPSLNLGAVLLRQTATARLRCSRATRTPSRMLCTRSTSRRSGFARRLPPRRTRRSQRRRRSSASTSPGSSSGRPRVRSWTAPGCARSITRSGRYSQSLFLRPLRRDGLIGGRCAGLGVGVGHRLGPVVHRDGLDEQLDHDHAVAAGEELERVGVHGAAAVCRLARGGAARVEAVLPRLSGKPQVPHPNASAGIAGGNRLAHRACIGYQACTSRVLVYQCMVMIASDPTSMMQFTRGSVCERV